MFTRRQFASGVGGAVTAGFAGCSSLSASDRPMDLEVVNYREAAVEIGIGVFRSGAETRSDARLYGNQVEIPTMSGEADTWREEAVAEAQPCRVELHVRSTEQSYHTHFVPDASPEDDTTGVRINLNEGPTVGFHRY